MKFTTAPERITRKREKELAELQVTLGHSFNSRELLEEALTHRSYINETPMHLRDNERLEFLGDSVLALVVNEYIYKRFPTYQEGELAKIKAKVVSEETLAGIARELDTGRFLLLGRGEEHTGGRDRVSILADTVEAIIGAIYLDAGLKAARRFVIDMLKERILSFGKIPTRLDPKSAVQEFVQKVYRTKPEYRLVAESGPDHSKSFEVILIINGREIARGSGSSIRRAETAAAIAALESGQVKQV
jgi:ribonuclease III